MLTYGTLSIGLVMFIESNYTFKNPRGFIVIDGVNGAGKGTLITRIIAYLNGKNIPFISSREPGGSELGAKLRPLILSEKCNGTFTELFLFSADRNEHIASTIKPALNDHKFVISDRFYYSTVAFQGYGRELPLDKIRLVNEIAVGDCLPDLFILLDLDAEEGLRRAAARHSTEIDKMEAEEIDFHNRLRRGFKELGESCKEPCLLVDASKSADEVCEAVRPTLDLLVEAWKQH